MHDQPTIPQPGDHIMVERCEWYGANDGSILVVTPYYGEGDEHRICVTKLAGTSIFYGPAHGPPREGAESHMEASGGPFRTVDLHCDVVGLVLAGKTKQRFWHWKDYPRNGGGIDRFEEVNLWTLQRLRDPHFRRMRDADRERARQNLNHGSDERE